MKAKKVLMKIKNFIVPFYIFFYIFYYTIKNYFNRDTRDRYIGFNFIEIYKDILS